MDRSKFIENFWWCQRRLKELSEKEDVAKAAYFRFMTLLGELALHAKSVTNCSAIPLVTCNEAHLICRAAHISAGECGCGHSGGWAGGAAGRHQLCPQPCRHRHLLSGL